MSASGYNQDKDKASYTDAKLDSTSFSAFFSLRSKIILVVIAAALISTLLIGSFFYKTSSDNALQHEVDKLTISLNMISPLFDDAFKRLQTDITVISKTPPIQGIIRASKNNGIDPVDGSSLKIWQNRLQTIFASVLSSEPNYVQLRYIGVADNGRELVRVNRNGTSIEYVTPEDLQPKANEFYFQKALGLSPDNFYLSPATLNREHGKIQEPYLPVIRMVLPVHDEQGKLFGMLVLNAAYEKVLETVLERLHLDHDLYVLDESGNHMIYKWSENRWSFSFSEIDANAADNPIVQAVINSPEEAETLFTDIDNEKTLFHFIKRHIDHMDQDRFLAVALSVPKSVLLEPTNDATRTAFLLTLCMIFISGICATALGRVISKPIKQMIHEIHAYSNGKKTLNLPTDKHDEIGYLARAFDDMLHAITQKELELKSRAKILEDSLNEIYIFDAQTLKFLQVNRGARENIGYTIEELVEMSPLDIKPEHTAETFSELISPLLNKEKEKIVFETIHKRKNGSLYNVEAHLQLVTFENRTFFAAIILDTTDRKHAEDEIIRSNEELERFAYIASHDLQEPLRMVTNFTHLLAEEYGDDLDEQALKYMEFITDASKRMQALVSDLLDYSRVGRKDSGITEFDVKHQLDVVLENLSEIIQESGANITIHDMPEITGNPLRFSRLMQNLIGNGLKYRKAGTSPKIIIKATEKNNAWLFSVQDNGIGIQHEYLKQIFVIFKRLHNKNQYSGTGIGLAICKKIVEGFGGRIWVESEPEKGSCFYFTIPKYTEEFKSAA